MKDSSKQFAPLKKTKRAFESVAFAIKEAIFQGHFKPGDRLPSENDLARQFNVSRHTIREALRTLELSGFLEIKTGVSGGPIVNDQITTVISDLYFDAFQMESISVDEFVSARLVVEKAIFSEACKRMDAEHIEKLKMNIQQAKERIKQKKFPTVLNFEFHSLLGSASQNKIFSIFQKGILSIMQNFRLANPVSFSTSKSATLDHEKILKAIIKKDYEAASITMEEHIIKIGKSFISKK